MYFHITSKAEIIKLTGSGQEPSGEVMDKLLNVEEFAEAVGWKPATVRQKVWRREIEFVRMGRSIRFKPETAEKLIERGTVPPRERD
jgi:excisionase family DNA binding protein